MGKLIAFEGIDGSGKHTQSKLLDKHFRGIGAKSSLLSFPMYETFFGKEVAGYLNGEFGSLQGVHPKLVSMLYACNRFEALPIIEKMKKQNDYLILDRYIPSNIAHQCAKVSDKDVSSLREWIEQEEYEVFGLPKPDTVVFLDMDPKISYELILKKSEREYTKRTRDMHEENYQYLERVHKIYIGLCYENEWLHVSCTSNDQLRNIEEIHSEIVGKIIVN